MATTASFSAASLHTTDAHAFTFLGVPSALGIRCVFFLLFFRELVKMILDILVVRIAF